MFDISFYETIFSHIELERSQLWFNFNSNHVCSIRFSLTNVSFVLTTLVTCSALKLAFEIKEASPDIP